MVNSIKSPTSGAVNFEETRQMAQEERVGEVVCL